MTDQYAGSRLYEYVRGLWGVPTTYIERTVAVATTPTQLAATNPRRMMLIVVNNSTVSTTVGYDPSLTVGAGITLTAGGASMTLTAEEDGELTGAAVYGIASTATGTWYVLEVIAL